MEYINLEFFFNLEREGKKSIVDFCLKMGFIASSYECPECKNPMMLTENKDYKRDGFSWTCRHKNRVRRSIRNGTWFDESRLSLPMMLKLAYLWVKKTSYVWIYHELKMTKNTVCDWMSFFRKVCVTAIKKEGIFIGGPSETVEIDAKSFAVQNKKGLETWVFGGVERSTKNCFLEVIQSGEENEIISILKKYVRPGTIIISDTWSGYNCLESNGYVHKKFSKASGFKDQATGIHRNNILSLWGRVKSITGNRIGNNQFESHLAEIMFRRLHRGDTQKLLMSFFKVLSLIFTPSIRDDPLRKVEKEKQKDCIKTQSKEVNTDDCKGEIQSEELNAVKKQQETQLEKEDTSNHKEQGESFCDVQNWENQCIEEIEVPLLFSEDISEDEFEGENGRQKKRLKTMESLEA